MCVYTCTLNPIFPKMCQRKPMSFVVATPCIGNKILVPCQYSHNEEDAEDEYFILHEIKHHGDGVCYSVTKLDGGDYGTVFTDPNDILHLNLDEFYMFREFFIMKT